MGLSSFAMVVLIVASFSSHPVVYSLNPSTIKEWCAKTYNPEPCEHLLANNPKYASVQIHGKDDFLKVSLQLALDRAINASKTANELGPKCINQNEKAAWANCVHLFDKNVAILSQTVHPKYNNSGAPTTDQAQTLLDCDTKHDHPSKKHKPFDVRALLTRCLTNIDNCEQGFLDLDIPDNVRLMILDTVLDNLLVNALALAKGMP